MNFFILDKNPIKCAKYHCDKHTVKMILETAQMLCGLFHQHNIDAPYKLGKAHYKHPCYLWLTESADNFCWAMDLLGCLLDEYTNRYGKVHKTTEVYNWILDNVCDLDIEYNGLTEFAQAMPDKYKNSDVVKAYRDYYISDKSGFAKWKSGDIPYWFKKV